MRRYLNLTLDGGDTLIDKASEARETRDFEDIYGIPAEWGGYSPWRVYIT